MDKKILKFLIFFSLPFFLFSFSLARERKLEVEYPEIFGLKPETVAFGLPEYLKYVYNAAILVAGLLILASLIIGGVKYLTSFGRVTRLKEAREQIASAFLGIIILLSSYIILTTINPQLVIFHLPLLKPIEKVVPPPPPSFEEEETSLITLEIPYGQQIKNGVWEKEWREKTENLLKEDEEFFEKETKVKTSATEAEIVFERISDLNDYLKTLTEDCQCENTQGLCTEPKNFCIPVGCFGDPCKKVREKMNKVMEVNQSKSKTILDFQEKIEKEKKKLEKELATFNDIESEMIACEESAKSLYSLNEYLDLVEFLEEQGRKVEKITIPGAPPPKADPLTFYCPAGGTIFDYPYYLKGPEAISEVPVEEELPGILVAIGGISCPVEFPLGGIVDQLRELAASMILKLEKLAKLHQEMASEIEKMQELVSECNNKNCQINCKCFPNPCFLICPPIPCPFACTSPCLQCLGGGGACSGEACPREKIVETSNKIREIEDKILETLKKEIKPIFPKVASLLKTEENRWDLENVKKGIKFCYSSEFEKPTWLLLNCQSAIGNYGPHGQIIDDCHPRNFFCCTDKKLTFPSETPPPTGLIYRIPKKKYQPLKSVDNCPEGWLCDHDVKYYNQYNDASTPLKEFLSCMRMVLDSIQKEEKIKETIGRISSISDSKLHKGTCNWETGPTQPGGCSHKYEIKYQKPRVSAHYGGLYCRYEKKSYAVDIGDEENYDYIKEAAKKCDPGAYVLRETDHVHISISEAHNKCGAQ